MNELYLPSNGTEGDIFMSMFCERCQRDNFEEETGEGGCDIIAHSMCGPVAEWIYRDGKPYCIKFAPENTCPIDAKPKAPKQTPGQLSLGMEERGNR